MRQLSAARVVHAAIVGAAPSTLPIISAKQQTPKELPAEKRSVEGAIHGTVDVVVSTKEGFALATDSRVTYGTSDAHSDDARKLYTVGDHTACVIAGLVGSQIGSDGFELRDAIGTSLTLLDQSTKRPGTPPIGAFDVARRLERGLDRVRGLLKPDTRVTPGLIGEVSAVTVKPDKSIEWLTIALPLRSAPNSDLRLELSVGEPIYFLHSTYLGPRFDVEILGSQRLRSEC